jgi:hypothetical protein
MIANVKKALDAQMKITFRAAVNDGIAAELRKRVPA